MENSRGSITGRTQLLSGVTVPVLGLGTWPMSDADAERAVAQALEIGYRLIDTAENYRNEEGVGKGLRASGLPREQVFVTTKFNVQWHGSDLVRQAAEASAERLGVDYLDRLLIHWPNPQLDRYVEAWQGLVELREAGFVRAIGVSNFKVAHLERIIDATGVAPDVNQIQCNPYAARTELRAWGERHGTATEAWSPLGKNTELLQEEAVTAVAAAHGRTPAQVVLRWHLQLGNIAIPKTISPGRMRQNLDVFDFELSASEMDAISALDRGEETVTDSDVFGH